MKKCWKAGDPAPQWTGQEIEEFEDGSSYLDQARVAVREKKNRRATRLLLLNEAQEQVADTCGLPQNQVRILAVRRRPRGIVFVKMLDVWAQYRNEKPKHYVNGERKDSSED